MDNELTFEKLKQLQWFRECCSEFRLFREMAREVLMNNLAPRVYALSKGGYFGCGFHYDMEQTLGKLINRLAICDSPSTINMNDYDKIQEKVSLWIVWEVLFEGLCEDVIAAEESKKHA